MFSCGLLTPEHGDANGRGTVRKYSFDNVMQIGVIKELMMLGLTYREIKETFDDNQKQHLKNLNYDCVFLLQWLMIWGWDKEKRFRYTPQSNFIDMKQFKEFKAGEVFLNFNENRETDKWEILDSGFTAVSALIINISEIYKKVIEVLNGD